MSRFKITLSPQTAARFETMSRDSETASQSICRLLNDEWRRRAMKGTVANPTPRPAHSKPKAPDVHDTRPRAIYFRQTGHYPEATG